MLDQNTFMETIREVTEIMKTSEETLSREQILSYFDSMDLNENQKNIIFESLIKTLFHQLPPQHAQEVLVNLLHLKFYQPFY